MRILCFKPCILCGTIHAVKVHKGKRQNIICSTAVGWKLGDLLLDQVGNCRSGGVQISRVCYSIVSGAGIRYPGLHIAASERKTARCPGAKGVLHNLVNSKVVRACPFLTILLNP